MIAMDAQLFGWLGHRLYSLRRINSTQIQGEFGVKAQAYGLVSWGYGSIIEAPTQ